MIKAPLFLLTLFTACAPSLVDDTEDVDPGTDVTEVAKEPVDTVTETLADGSWMVLLDATSERIPVLLDLDTRFTTLGDEWDVSLVRYDGYLNEGVGIQVFEEVAFDDVTEAGGAWLEGDEAILAFSLWWGYALDTHELTPLDMTFLVRSTDDVAYKLRFEDYYADAGTPATVALRVGLLDPAE